MTPGNTQSPPGLEPRQINTPSGNPFLILFLRGSGKPQLSTGIISGEIKSLSPYKNRVRVIFTGTIST